MQRLISSSLSQGYLRGVVFVSFILILFFFFRTDRKCGVVTLYKNFSLSFFSRSVLAVDLNCCFEPSCTSNKQLQLFYIETKIRIIKDEEK